MCAFIGPSRCRYQGPFCGHHEPMADTDVLGDPPYATPELPRKASKACPADLGSLSEFTPTKRGSPKVNTPSTETAQMQHAGVHRGACPLTHALTSLQVPRGISPTGAAKRCLLDLLEMENRRETPATPSRGRRDVLHIAPGAPKRRLGSLEREPTAQRRTLSLDCDPDMGFFHEETPLAKRARLWFVPIAPATTTAAVPEPEGQQPGGEVLQAQLSYA